MQFLPEEKGTPSLAHGKGDRSVHIFKINSVVHLFLMNRELQLTFVIGLPLVVSLGKTNGELWVV